MALLKTELIKELETRSIYFFGALTGILIFFQASFAFNSFAINLNLADVLAIAAASIFFLEINKHKNINFILPNLMRFMLLAICAYVFALLNGIAHFGPTSYAFVTKFMGFFMLIGYAALGIAYKINFGTPGIKLLIKIMTTTLLIILSIEVFINFLYLATLYSNDTIFNPILSGYANNRNAFAMQLLVVGCITFIYNEKNWLPAIIFTGVIFTYSRSAIVTLICIAALTYALQLIKRKRVLKIIGLCLLFSVILFSLEWLVFSFAPMIRNYLPTNGMAKASSEVIFSINLYSYESSNSQRLYTFIESAKLWLQSPFLGIGLGGFVYYELLKNQLFLVIHNTFLWVLVEFGILGASVFFWYGCVLIKHFFIKLKTTSARSFSQEDKSLLLLLLIFAAMGNAHEIFYQRILWLAFGLLVVTTAQDKLPSDEPIIIAKGHV